MINLNISKSYSQFIPQDILFQDIKKILEYLGIDSNRVITVVIGSDQLLRKLNHQFLSIDKSTDVLSFPSDEEDPETHEKYFGDIVISFPRARSQAKEAGHDVSDEIRLLLIHGILHLSGYDHQDAKQKMIMWNLQEKLIRTLGLRLNKISGDDESYG